MSPSASRLITTPEMIWSTRNVTETSACSAAMRPPVSTATPIEIHNQPGALRVAEHDVHREPDAGRGEHHALDRRC